MLSDQLPNDPDELQALFDELLEEDNSAVGYASPAGLAFPEPDYDLKSLSTDQLLGLMHESINRSLINFYGAMEVAPDDESRIQIQDIIREAEEVRDEIDRAFGEPVLV